jgi:hypothetical protein
MHWDTNNDGKVTVCPLVRFGINVIGQTVCAIRLEFARTPNQLRDGPQEGVQLVMTHPQLIALAKALSEAATHIVTSRPAGAPN